MFKKEYDNAFPAALPSQNIQLYWLSEFLPCNRDDTPWEQIKGGRTYLCPTHWLPGDKDWPCIYIGYHRLPDSLPMSPHLGICSHGREAGIISQQRKLRFPEGLMWGCARPCSLERMLSQGEGSNSGREVGEGLGTQVGTGARGATPERLPKQSALQCTASISNNCVMWVALNGLQFQKQIQGR